jgi:hypothetical protein
MTDEERERICREVWRRMGEWEADDGHGSARPIFQRAWATATRVLREPTTAQEFEAAWQRWLRNGPALTPERAAALLADAETRAKDGQLFAGSTLRRRREPGEDG